MRFVIAPDSFKGSLSAIEAATIMKNAIINELPNAEVTMVPMADGGEGTLEAFIHNERGREIQIEVTGPLDEKIVAAYGVLDDEQTAVIEIAKIVGLPLVPFDKRNPYETTTYGIGEAIIDAIERGYRKFIIGLGGSCTNDGGLGMLQALGATFRNTDGEPVGRCGKSLLHVATVDFSALHPLTHECQFLIASDVDNPLCGKRGASYVYGPQKGATAYQVEELDRALNRYATIIEQTTGKSLQNASGAGAAGGLGYAFLLLNGVIVSGAKLVANVTKLAEKIENADWVITGEGRSDGQTLNGKVPVFVALLAKKHGAKAILISGSLGEGYEKLYEHFISCSSIINEPMDLEKAMKNAKELLYLQTKNIARIIKTKLQG